MVSQLASRYDKVLTHASDELDRVLADLQSLTQAQVAYIRLA